MDTEKRLALKLKDATAVAGVGETTLYEQMNSGSLPYLKVGRCRLIMTDDLQRWLEAHRVTPGAV